MYVPVKVWREDEEQGTLYLPAEVRGHAPLWAPAAASEPSGLAAACLTSGVDGDGGHLLFPKDGGRAFAEGMADRAARSSHWGIEILADVETAPADAVPVDLHSEG